MALDVVAALTAAIYGLDGGDESAKKKVKRLDREIN